MVLVGVMDVDDEFMSWSMLLCDWARWGDMHVDACFVVRILCGGVAGMEKGCGESFCFFTCEIAPGEGDCEE